MLSLKFTFLAVSKDKVVNSGFGAGFYVFFNSFLLSEAPSGNWNLIHRAA